MAAPDPFSSLYLLTPSHHLTYPNSHRSQSLSPTESESCSLSSTDFVWQWASVSFVADTLALICPLCVLCLTIILRMSQSSQKQFCFKSSLHSHFSQFTESLSPSPSLCCILLAATGAQVFISLGYYYARTQRGQLHCSGSVLGMPCCWREDCHYRQLSQK